MAYKTHARSPALMHGIQNTRTFTRTHAWDTKHTHVHPHSCMAYKTHARSPALMHGIQNTRTFTRTHAWDTKHTHVHPHSCMAYKTHARSPALMHGIQNTRTFTRTHAWDTKLRNNLISCVSRISQRLTPGGGGWGGEATHSCHHVAAQRKTTEKILKVRQRGSWSNAPHLPTPTPTPPQVRH